ncbi:SH3 domain-containing protein [Candidatus Pelagibacter sp.]|nr:SH3 domain-containing protein [Candidatus Pelagibacter sp.]
MKKLINSILFFTIIFLIFSFFETKEASAHPSKKHKPMVCILEQDRTEGQKRTCKQLLFFHRLCKLDQDCAILELEKKKKEIQSKETEIKNLEDEIGGLADCGDIPFNHKASSNAKVYQKPSSKSKVVSNIKKGQEMLFISPSQENKNWYYVKIKKDNNCADGYIKQKFVVKKAGEDTIIKVGPKLIEINQPSWVQEDKLILIDAEGTVSITGAIQEGKIDQIIINEEEEIINSDNSFTFLLFVPSSGSEVRIIGNKNGKKVKELTFKVKVGK